ncbi:WD40 repeat-like protein [Violaceomyces palustris]|uniref:WD40 repeat-like protein n=1 Tax=Violaceomyces palustris TaxID=1673888 RepID=A0ACD0NMN7_9BASI|nr:WD40 repeat-like protein [Violaceomyces palustris]
MSSSTAFQQLTPSSSFYSPPSFQTDLHRLKALQLSNRTSLSSSSNNLYRKPNQLNPDFVHRLDRVSILGGTDQRGHAVGHTGCINALSWSPSGQLLASGSDDTNVAIWKVGSSEENPNGQARLNNARHPAFRYRRGGIFAEAEDAASMRPLTPNQAQALTVDAENPWATTTSYPDLSIGMSGLICTGHRANIFSVKWAPNCSDRRLFTCAGDKQVRVFDLSRASDYSIESMSCGREFTKWETHSGACIKTFRCHRGRAKRISTENSPDVFLTCAEDGEVRQMDLRTHHTCGPLRSYNEGCPAPLARFPMGLYSLSVSKVEPWLFAVAGMSRYAYLHDRRMIPRLLKSEWGITLDADTTSLTQCVRRFGIPPGSFESPTIAANGEPLSRGTARRGFDKRTEPEVDEDAHITACKISESSGREIVVSYSGGGIYRFGIYDETGVLNHTPSDPIGHDDRVESDQKTLEPYVLKMRQRVAGALFPHAAKISPKRREALMDDLDDLDELTVKATRDKEDTEDEKTAVLICRCLAKISENEDLVATSLEMMRPSFTHPWAGSLILLMEELELAIISRDRTEADRVKFKLWDEAEEFVRDVWGEEAFDKEERSKVLRHEAEYMQGLSTARGLRARENGRGDDDDRAGSVSKAPGVGEGARTEAESSEASDTNQITSTSLTAPLSSVQNEIRVSPRGGSETSENGVEGPAEDSNAEGSEEDEEDDENDEESEQDSRSGLSMDEDEEMMLMGDVDLEEMEMNDWKREDEEDAEGYGEAAPIIYPRNVYRGHANNETVKDVNFAGPNDEYVVSGSDDGNWFLWDTETSKLQGLWEGDSSVVNVLQPHPTLPVMAISGIDDTVKIFAPVTGGGKRVTDRMGERDRIVSENAKRGQRSSITSRALLSMLRSHMVRVGGEGGEGIRNLILRTNAAGGAEAEDESGDECVVM